MAIICSEMSDHDRAEHLYRKAAEADGRAGAPLYNLALLLRDRGERAEAIEALDRAIARDRKGSYLVFRARLAGEAGDEAGRCEFLTEAFRAFLTLRELDDFELNAYIRGARAAEDEARIAQGMQEHERRNTPLDSADVGELPIMPNGG